MKTTTIDEINRLYDLMGIKKIMVESKSEGRLLEQIAPNLHMKGTSEHVIEDPSTTRDYATIEIGEGTPFPVVFTGLKFPIVVPPIQKATGLEASKLSSDYDPNLFLQYASKKLDGGSGGRIDVDVYGKPVSYDKKVNPNSEDYKFYTNPAYRKFLPIKQFNANTKVRQFFEENKQTVLTFGANDKLDNGDPAPQEDGRNEYIVIGGKKYCIPTKSWMDVQIQNQYVYQFTNYKTKDTFAMILKFMDEVSLPGLEKMKGYEAAQACLGENRGWGWKMDIPTEANKGQIPGCFYLKKGGNPSSFKPTIYDPNKDANPNSRFDDWWDSGWGIAIEIAVGVAAAFLTGGASAALMGAAKAGQLGARLGQIVVAASEMSYAGGTVSLLTPIVGSLVEFGMMLPIAQYYVDRGMYDDAILSMVFCFLPFFTELPAVNRLFKFGTIAKQEFELLGDEIVEKVFRKGGWNVVSQLNPAERIQFLADLSPKARLVFMETTKDLSKESAKPIVERGINLIAKQNSEKVVAKMAEKPDTFWGKAANLVIQQNPLPKARGGGKGAIANLIRMGGVIGLTVIGFKTVYNRFLREGVDESVAQEAVEKLNKALQDDVNGVKGYFTTMAELEKTGILENGYSQTKANNFLEDLCDNNPQFIETMVKDKKVQEELINPMLKKEVEVQKKELGEQCITMVEDYKTQYNIVEKMMKYKNLMLIRNCTNLTEKDLLGTYLKGLGYEVKSWDETQSQTNWKFTTVSDKPGEIVFSESGTEKTKFFIDGKEIIQY